LLASSGYESAVSPDIRCERMAKPGKQSGDLRAIGGG